MSSSPTATAGAVAQSVLEAFGSGDVDSLLELFAEDAVIRVAGAPHVPFVGEYSSAADRRAFFTDHMGEAVNHAMEVRGVLETGDDVVILGYFDFEVTATGRHYLGDFALRLHVEAGRIALWQMYEDSWNVAQAFDA